MVAASLIVEVALGKGPNDTVVDGDYTDLSDRVLGFAMDRGRDDRTQTFDPGTCSILLDNQDRELDPLRAGSMVNLADELGLPLCPIRVSVTYDGSDHRVFTGYIGPEPWRPLPNEVDGKPVVRLDAMDRLAYMAIQDLPTSPFAAQVKWLAPEWWIRGMVPGQVTAGVADELLDSSGNEFTAEIATSVGGNVLYQIGSLVPGDNDSALTHEEGVSVYTDEATLTGTEANITMGVVWRGTPDGTDQEIMRQRVTSGSVVRWRVECQTTGDIVAIVYDSGGAAATFVAAPSNLAAGSGGRWDDDEPHLIFCRIEGGTRMRIWVDGRRDETTTSVPASVAGRVIFGGGSQLASFDEAMFWTRAVSTADLDRITDAFTGDADPFDGDTYEARLERWWDLTNHPRGVSDIEMVLLAGTEDTALYGITDMPGSLADAIEATAVSFMGTAFIKRDGVLRARTLAALSDFAPSGGGVDPEATLTDDPDASETWPVVRRTQPEFTGIRLDRVANRFRVTIQGIDFEISDPVSIARYGERVLAWTSDKQDPDYPTIPALPSAVDLAEVSTPTWDLEPVTVYPLLDVGAADWVFPVLELEQLVAFEWVDGGYLYATELQVQGESWMWERDRLEVSVTLGRSRGVATVTASTFSGDPIVLGSEADDVLTSETDIDLGATV